MRAEDYARLRVRRLEMAESLGGLLALRLTIVAAWEVYAAELAGLEAAHADAADVDGLWAEIGATTGDLQQLLRRAGLPLEGVPTELEVSGALLEGLLLQVCDLAERLPVAADGARLRAIAGDALYAVRSLGRAAAQVRDRELRQPVETAA